MKKIIILLVIIALVGGIYAAWKYRVDVAAVCLKVRNEIAETFGKTAFKKISQAPLSDGMIKSTFQTTDRMNDDIEISIISKEPIVLASSRKNDDKTVVVFQPSNR
ncbi:MAG: hypothetical protein ABIH74_05215 [Candidatus Omnitrophota bacterium]